jgi:ABC-type lipoprotein release transport system permease subunit
MFSVPFLSIESLFPVAVALVGVTPSDPVTLISVAVLLAAVGLVASYIPARRAMNVEPLRALKYE